MDFLLLQTSIHHPNGSVQSHAFSCAVDWNAWQRCLKMIYSLLMKEIHFFFKLNQKNKSFFLNSGDTLRVSCNFSVLFREVSRQVRLFRYNFSGSYKTLLLQLFTYPDVDVTMSLDCYSVTQGPQKRQKFDITLNNYINNIQETKSWLW